MLTSPQGYNADEGNGVQINCIECEGKAIIVTRAEKDPKVADLYCSCKDPLCGHTFVLTLAFSHTLSPSAKNSKKLVVDLLKLLPASEQRELFQQANIH